MASCFAVNATCAFCERLRSVRTDILVGAVDGVIFMTSPSNQLRIMFGVSVLCKLLLFFFLFVRHVVMKHVSLSVLATVGDVCCVPMFIFFRHLFVGGCVRCSWCKCLLHSTCIYCGCCSLHFGVSAGVKCLFVLSPSVCLEGMGRLSCVRGQPRNKRKKN